jgi:hypothetical protein
MLKKNISKSKSKPKSKPKSPISSKKIYKSTIINTNIQNLTNTENNTPSISTNKNTLFNMNVFTKINSNNYNTQENCLKNKKKYFQTNPKFEKFDQKYYTCGDYDDFDKYGILSSLYFLSDHDSKNNINKNILNKIKKNKSLFKLYNNIDIQSIINTFTYIFYKFKKGIFVIIHNNQLALFLPFSNAHYINNWYDKIYFSLEEKKLLQENDYEKIQHIIKQKTREFAEKYPDQFKARGLEFNRKKWVANGCVFQNHFKSYEGGHDIDVFKTFINQLCKNRSIPNVQFFINYRDFPILKKDLTEPYFHLFDSDNIPIEKKYAFSKFCPIFSQSNTDNYADLLIPTSDEWIMHSQKFFTDDCSNSYQPDMFKNMISDWSKKINKVVFRGSATQCGSDLDTNQRLKAAQLGFEHPDILDVGITSWKQRMKKYKNQEMKIIDTKQFEFDLVPPLTRKQQSTYKFILHIPGYVGAFRLSSEFRLHSTLLIVNSDYKLWFSDLLVPYTHFVPVKEDLSDLLEISKWCIKNDKKCKVIAQNGYDFYQKYLTKDGLFDYMQTTLTQIYLNRNLKNPLSVKKTKKNIAVITLFRPQKETNRESQRKLFIQYMNRVLPQYCDYHIYIIEQSDDGEKFSIAKLKNIGFEISSKKDKYDAFLFTDIDHLFDYDLLPYIVQKPKYPMCLAYKGTRYSKNFKLGDKPFFGGTNIFSEKDFKKINGYSINYQGWGYEDQSLLMKVHLSGINNIQYPENGQIVDTEMTLNMKPVKVENKTKYNEQKFETLGYEKLLIEPKYWNKNGLNNLDYKLLKTTKVNDFTTQYKVDLLLGQDRKKYPELFPKNNNMTTNQFKQFKRNVKIQLYEYFKKIKVHFV